MKGKIIYINPSSVVCSIIAYLLIVTSFIFSQGYDVTGRAFNEEGKKLGPIRLVVYDQDKKKVIEVETPNNGKFKLKNIPNPKNRFLADPFIVRKDGKNYCFVEDFDYKKNLGQISVYQIDREGHRELGSAISEDFHLSFPYIFEYKNQTFMCPETSDINEIR